MTDPTLNTAEPGQGGAAAKPTAGDILRKLREEKGHSYATVGAALHLTVHYVKALEGDDYGKLPGLTFVKGYLRSYARFLGADEAGVIACFDEHIAGLLDAGENTERVQRSRRRQDQALRWAIGAGLVVVAALFAGWWFMSEHEAPASVSQTRTPAEPATTTARPQPALANPPGAARSSTPLTGVYTPAPATAAPANEAATQTLRAIPGETVTLVNVPAPAPAATAIGAQVAPADTAADSAAGTLADATAIEQSTDALAPPPAADAAATVIITPNANGARRVSLVSTGEDELRVAFKGNSWIEVDDGSNVRLYNDMLSAGDTLSIRGKAPFQVLFGDARQVEVEVNTTAIDIRGDIRADSTARLVLGASGSLQSVLDEGAGEAAAGQEAPL